MAEEFLGADFIPSDSETESDREPLRMILIGSRARVLAEIHYLYAKGVAEVGDWSPLMPAPTNPGEVMSIRTSWHKRTDASIRSSGR